MQFITRVFLIGLLTGTLLAIIFKSITQPIPTKNHPHRSKYEKWFKSEQIRRIPITMDELRYTNHNYLTESEILRNKINVLCIVLVKKAKNAEAIKSTWGQSCNSLKFVNITLEKSKLTIPRAKTQSTWSILCDTLLQIPEKHSWILIVYDYSFVIVENLRYYVAGLNSNEGYYLGHVVEFWGHKYNKGQAGYVISQGALKKLKTQVQNCVENAAHINREDFSLGKHFEQLNVTPGDTRDQNGLSTFHPYNLYHLIDPGEGDYQSSLYPHKCCSPHSITFQGIEADKMLTYYYLLYTVQLFSGGGSRGNVAAKRDRPDEEVWKSFLRGRNVSTDVTSKQYYEIWANLIDDPTSFARNMKKEYFEYNNEN